MSLTLDRVAERLRREAHRAEGLNKTVKLDFGEDGAVYLDARESPPAISHDEGEADAVLCLSLDTLRALAEGGLDPMRALLTRKIRIEGDKGLALKLAGMLKKARA